MALLGLGDGDGGGFLGLGGGGQGNGRGIVGGVTEPIFNAVGINGYNLPVVGPMFFDDPTAKRMEQQIWMAAQAENAYRPIMADAAMNAMRQSMSAFDAPNRILGAQYGGGAMVDPSQLNVNPLPPQAFDNPNLGLGPPGAGGGGGGSTSFGIGEDLAQQGIDKAYERWQRNQRAMEDPRVEER